MKNIFLVAATIAFLLIGTYEWIQYGISYAYLYWMIGLACGFYWLYSKKQ